MVSTQAVAHYGRAVVGLAVELVVAYTLVRAPMATPSHSLRLQTVHIAALSIADGSTKPPARSSSYLPLVRMSQSQALRRNTPLKQAPRKRERKTRAQSTPFIHSHHTLTSAHVQTDTARYHIALPSSLSASAPGPPGAPGLASFCSWQTALWPSAPIPHRP